MVLALGPPFQISRARKRPTRARSSKHVPAFQQSICLAQLFERELGCRALVDRLPIWVKFPHSLVERSLQLGIRAPRYGTKDNMRIASFQGRWRHWRSLPFLLFSFLVRMIYHRIVFVIPNVLPCINHGKKVCIRHETALLL